MKMLRQVITDVIWNELEATLRKYGCHRRKNDRNIMEAILWKLRTGAPWRGEMFPKNFARGKQPIIDLIAGPPKAYGIIFF